MTQDAKTQGAGSSDASLKGAATEAAAKPLEAYTPEEREKFFSTGELVAEKADEKKSDGEGTQPPEGEKKGEGEKGKESKPDEKKPDAGAGDGKPPERSTAETRKEELAKDIQDHLRRRHEAKAAADAEEARLAKLREGGEKKPDATGEKEPVPEDFKTYEEFVDAKARWAVRQEQAVADRKRAEDEQTKRVQEVNKEISERWKRTTAEARKSHEDFDAIITNDEFVAKIAPGTVVDAVILGRELGAEIFYHLGKNPTELDEILKLNPLGQAFALAAIEQKIQSAKQAEADKAKKGTDAPPPPAELSGAKGAPADAVTEALRKGDFAAYQEEMNKKELAATKK